VHERRLRPQRSQHVLDAHPAPAVDRDRRDLALPLGGQADGRVLHRRDHLVRTPDGGPPTRGGDRLRGPAREHHLAGTRPEQRGDLLARLLHRHPAGQALGVDAPRITGAIELLDERSPGLGSQRRRRGVVEVHALEHGLVIAARGPNHLGLPGSAWR
jgi:hypothetical protein